ncbi:MAG: peptidylprolyl isomerase [bacterium]
MRIQTILLAAGLMAAVAGCDNASTPKADAPKAETAAQTNNDQAKTEEAASDTELPMTATGVVAKVDGVDIPASEFNKEVERLIRVAPQLPPQALQKFKTTTVDRLIDQMLVEKTLDAEKVTAEPAEIESELKEFYDSVGGPEGAKEFFDKAGVSEEELRGDLGRAVKLKKYLKTKYGVEVTDAKAKEFYDQNIERFKRPEEVRASHILLKVDDKTTPEQAKEQEAKAKKVLKLAKAKGADFAELAKTNSEGPTAPTGGDLNFFARERMVPEFSEAAFKAKVGDVVGPVKTQFGYHIIKVTDRRPEQVTSFEEVKPEIIRNLERKELRDGMEKLVKELRDKAKIEDLSATAIKENPNFKSAAPPMFNMPPMGNHPQMPAPTPTQAPPTPSKGE